MFATARHGNNSPNSWMLSAHFPWVLLVLVRWTPICVDRISRNDKILSCLPSKMTALVDLDCALGSLPALNLPHDAKRRWVCGLARSAANRDDNVSTHDIYFENGYERNWILWASRFAGSTNGGDGVTYLAHKYSVYTGANLKFGTFTSKSEITCRKNDSWCVSGNSRTAGRMGSWPALCISPGMFWCFGLSIQTYMKIKCVLGKMVRSERFEWIASTDRIDGIYFFVCCVSKVQRFVKTKNHIEENTEK